MKKSTLKRINLFCNVALLLFAGLSFSACKKEVMDHSTKKFKLMAGQHIEAGYLEVSRTDDVVKMTYVTSGDWKMEECQLFVGEDLSEMPKTNSGNPKIGNFPYKQTFNEATSTYSFEYKLENTKVKSLSIAAHSTLMKEVPNEPVQRETAWSEGDPINDGGSWATYSKY